MTLDLQAVGMVRAVAAGDLTAAPALLDALGEARDDRLPSLRIVLGALVGRAQRVHRIASDSDRTDERLRRAEVEQEQEVAWQDFSEGFTALFWEELSDRQLPALIGFIQEVLGPQATAARIAVLDQPDPEPSDTGLTFEDLEPQPEDLS